MQGRGVVGLAGSSVETEDRLREFYWISVAATISARLSEETLGAENMILFAHLLLENTRSAAYHSTTTVSKEAQTCSLY